TTRAWAASSAPSPVPTGRCSTTATRGRRTSATFAAALRRAPRPARRKPSRSTKLASETGSVISPRSGRRGSCAPIMHGWRDGHPSCDRRRRHRGAELYPHDPRGRGSGVGDHPGVRRAPLLAHGAPILSRREHRRVPRLHGHAGFARRVEGQDDDRTQGDAATQRPAHADAGRRRHRGLRRLPDCHGSRAAKAPVPGADGPGVHSFWTLEEARAVIAAVTPGSKVVMVGAGFISFTILNAILSRGAQLTIVEVAPR